MGLICSRDTKSLRQPCTVLEWPLPDKPSLWIAIILIKVETLSIIMVLGVFSSLHYIDNIIDFLFQFDNNNYEDEDDQNPRTKSQLLGKNNSNIS